ncbi:BPTI/Kunitz domain-containing protein [Sorangium sp. So ce693]|uniref:BPTI/Kunitz domain-containing protein n=1 Tax=Sorangium sp. So ce693 TaxID=3133318 RepID=UPI003F5EA3A2
MLTSLLLAAGCSGKVDRAGSGGGDPGGGGSSAETGGGGAGGDGQLPVRCLLPADPGRCDAAFPKYWYDPAAGACREFTYGGCEGNENRFDSLDACEEACRGELPDIGVCNAPSDCVLVSRGCCGACDTASAENFGAINRAGTKLDEIIKGCGGVACGACPEVTEAERTTQYFTATCEAGRCVVLDVRESPLTECAIDSDCVLRDGLGCCEGCDGTGIVALSQSAELDALVCPAGMGACPPCAPVFPDGMTAVCSSGRCQPRMPATP